MNSWESIAAGTNGQYLPDDFEQAAYRLLTEQVIYHADKRSRTTYWLIERYERDFKTALGLLGVDVEVNRQLSYACAIPRHERTTPVSTGHTLMALVLRRIYDDAARAGDMNDHGEVTCDFVDLEEKYRLMTGRELPGKSEVDATLKQLRRWGIARRLDEDEISDTNGIGQNGVAIRPGIVEVLGQAAIDRIAAWAVSASTAGDIEPVDTENSGENEGEEHADA
ncbi:DUF4194 domain-containing protein [Thauera sp. Sel9]|uniref:DUF4194 domain-containing protein n=1 Tax=Thauera sp. Sel9 TaxID=2974299 RepID=UPI0021E136F0|nr:DUF4194 domain-containing protein [Thauera sp. Sel9]MCV2219880.1 DUF4194 domain-containing protein [Thauera sp. Sel9]